MSNNSFVGLFATNLNTTELRVQNIIPASGTLKNFFVFIEAAPGGATSWTFSARRNGANTTLTCTISGAATSCSDMTHSAAFVPGDLISVQIISSGVPAAARMQWTAQYAP